MFIVVGLVILFFIDDALIVVLVHQLDVLPIDLWVFGLLLTVLLATNTIFALAIYRAMRAQPMSGLEGIIGEVGKAITPIYSDGSVLVHGEIWQAESQLPIAAGTRVRVEAIEGLQLKVKQC